MTHYFCRLDPDPEGGFTAVFPDLPGCLTEGETVDEALAMAAEALNGCLESDVAHGFPLPDAATGPGEGLYPVAVEPHILVAWELRKLRGDLSQSEIASRLGIPYQSYQRLENPAKSNPTVKTLQKVARAFGKRVEINLV
ncbi:MAG: helix-turn-helix domain-containing protein [Rectinemataceae bacterium]